MNLSQSDGKLYWDLMIPLQFFCNRKLQILPQVFSRQEFEHSSLDQKGKVREALFKHPAIIDTYVAENPDDLSLAHLEIVGQWKNFIDGNFFIERFLKKHAIFILDDSVYGVLGLMDSIETLIGPRPLPVYVEALLLPFKGKIIIDGLLKLRNATFGGGIKRDLREAYLKAAQNDRIITSFDERPTPLKKAAAGKKNWEKIFADLRCAANAAKVGKDDPRILAPLFNLIKSSVEFGECATSETQTQSLSWQQYNQIIRHVRAIHRVISRTEK